MVHVEDSVDPVRDLETIMYELCRKDTVYVESVRTKKELDVKKDPKNKLPPVSLKYQFINKYFCLYLCFLNYKFWNICLNLLGKKCDDILNL